MMTPEQEKIVLHMILCWSLDVPCERSYYDIPTETGMVRVVASKHEFSIYKHKGKIDIKYAASLVAAFKKFRDGRRYEWGHNHAVSFPNSYTHWVRVDDKVDGEPKEWTWPY